MTLLDVDVDALEALLDGRTPLCDVVEYDVDCERPADWKLIPKCQHPSNVCNEHRDLLREDPTTTARCDTCGGVTFIASVRWEHL